MNFQINFKDATYINYIFHFNPLSFNLIFTPKIYALGIQFGLKRATPSIYIYILGNSMVASF